MKEYIEKQQAIDAAREDGKKIPTLAIRIMHDIKAIPAADVVPVVRCKDCKHWNPQFKTANGNGLGSCDFHNVALVTSEGFCYWAEKRGDNDEKQHL